MVIGEVEGTQIALYPSHGELVVSKYGDNLGAHFSQVPGLEGWGETGHRNHRLGWGLDRVASE